MGRRMKWKVLLILAVVIIFSIFAFPPQEKINLGLDLQGGMHLVLKVDLSKVPEVARKDATNRALEVIRNRIDEFGVTEPSIRKQGKDHIIVQLPGVRDRERALEIVGKTAHLEFRMVAHDPELISQALDEEKVPEDYEILELKEEDRQERLLVKKKAVLSGDKLINAGVTFDQGTFGQPIVTLEFNKEGARIFSDVTGKATNDFRQDGIRRRLAIVLDGELRSAPQIKERIPSGKAVITGNFSYQEASDIALVLRAGALPAPVVVEEERTVGPELGSDSIRQSVRAMIVGSILVVFFMAVYYLIAGMIAIFALLLNILIIMGVLSGFNAALTLPGIAGIILTIGMAIDANVLIFERIREELKLGKHVRSAISGGYHKAFKTILDANVTTLITALLLFKFGTGPVRGFAVTLTVGILASMFTAIFVTRVIFDLLTKKREIKLKMFQLFGETSVKFTKTRFIAYAFSAVLIIGGVFSFVSRGEGNFGVDFTGGTLEQVKFTKPVELNVVRQALIDRGLECQIQNFGDVKLNEVLIRTKTGSAEEIDSALAELVGMDGFNVLRLEKVGPSVGSDLRKKALLALGFALVAMCIYISWRFRFKFAIAAIIALLHDAVITIGLFSITGRELSLPIIAALLTIVGYSINDTIVVFDRIREDMKLMRKTAFPDVVNASINQTLSRTVLTSGTTLLVVLSLLFLGGPVINDFAFTLFVGVLIGTYSSIYVASPILVDWGVRR